MGNSWTSRQESVWARNNFLVVIRLPNIKVMTEIRSRKGHLVCFAQIRKAFTILIGKPEKKLQYLGRRGGG